MPDGGGGKRGGTCSSPLILEDFSSRDHCLLSSGTAVQSSDFPLVQILGGGSSVFGNEGGGTQSSPDLEKSRKKVR